MIFTVFFFSVSVKIEKHSNNPTPPSTSNANITSPSKFQPFSDSNLFFSSGKQIEFTGATTELPVCNMPSGTDNLLDFVTNHQMDTNRTQQNYMLSNTTTMNNEMFQQHFETGNNFQQSQQHQNYTSVYNSNNNNNNNPANSQCYTTTSMTGDNNWNLPPDSALIDSAELLQYQVRKYI